VDGLRGLSILCVVLFHATGSLEGGFIGVDVFFVISGYLITSILLRELRAQGTVSLGAFWERRIRRILPASAVMAMVTLLLGTLILLPEDLRGLGRSLIAHALTVSNFYFWRDSGYFDGASEEKPLLHTWSLAVEEQFYLLYPLLFLLLGKLLCKRAEKTDPARLLLPMFSFAVVGGLLLSVWMVRKDASMAFYLLPSRFWELLLGGVLACLPVGWMCVPASWSRTASVAGLSLVLGSALQLRDTMPFPGLLAAPPCLGAALLIWSLAPGQSGTQRFWLRRVMESSLLVGLGLISYSLYLWHWPLLAFWDYVNAGFSDRVDDAMRLVMVLLALAAAYASWRWVETPFRRPNAGTTRGRVFASAFAAAAVLVAAGFWMHENGGLPARWTPAQLRLAQAQSEMGVPGADGDAFERLKEGNLPRFGAAAADAPLEVLVWGDSHAWCLSPAIAALAEQHGRAGLLATYPSTPPGLGFVQPSTSGLGTRAIEWGEGILRLVKERRIPDVVLVGYWRRIAKGRIQELKNCLELTVRRFREEAGAQVWVVRDVPAHDILVPRALALHQRLPWLFPDPTPSACTEAEHRRANASFDSMFDDLARTCGLRILDPTPALTDGQGRYLLQHGGQSLYADVGHHLSIAGALHVSAVFQPLFQNESPAR
jgi:peptidoglycan/LPS O-acetylase OafA/YrhL